MYYLVLWYFNFEIWKFELENILTGERVIASSKNIRGRKKINESSPAPVRKE
jgi:hypothetical protein